MQKNNMFNRRKLGVLGCKSNEKGGENIPYFTILYESQKVYPV
jgi:hypothetical protein